MKYILYLSVGVILIAAGLVFVNIRNRDNVKPPTSLEENGLNICKSDSDCIYVPYNHCCTTFRAINKNYLDEYNSHPEWQGVDRQACIDIPCSSTAPFGEMDPASSRCVSDYDGIKGNSRCI